MSSGSIEEREPTGAPEAAPLAVPPRQPGTTAPSADIAPVEAESVLPGGHRGGFQRLPTAPVDITSQSAPADPDGGYPAAVYQWAPPEPASRRHAMAGWALGFSIAGLAVSLFVGWGFPLGIAGVVAAILALRRPLESHAVAVWALVLGAVSIVYSAGWLVVAAARANLFGWG